MSKLLRGELCELLGTLVCRETCTVGLNQKETALAFNLLSPYAKLWSCA